MVTMSLKLLQLSCRCCCCAFHCGKSRCRCICSTNEEKLPKMDTDNDATKIEAISSDNKESLRGRSKKRGKGKKRSSKKEPFSRIAQGILPSAAVASASPSAAKHIGKSRSPSPVAKALAFVGRIGQLIPGGDKLQRSLSEKDIYKKSGPELAKSKWMSKSLPESSTFGEQAEEFETESGYEVVGEVRRKALAMVTNEEDDVASSVSNRGALPLPDEEDGAKETPKDVDDMYAKIVKHSTVKSKVVELQSGNELAEDSDDLTTVTEEDEEGSSKMSRTKIKHLALLSDDANDSPSDGEAYRLPFDAIRDYDHLRRFEPIEELDNEDISPRYRHGLVSPASARSKGSSHGSVGRPASTRSMSAQNFDTQSPRDSRPQTPQAFSSRSSPHEMGREAALRRLEELGFDGISEEFGIFPPSKEEHKESYIQHLQRKSSYEDEILPIVSNIEESTPLFDSIGQLESSENLEKEIPALNYGKGARTKRKRAAPQKLVVEEPLLQTVEVSHQESSNDLMLEELIDERHSSAWMNEPVSPIATKDESKLKDSIKSVEYEPPIELTAGPSTDRHHDQRRIESSPTQKSKKLPDEFASTGISEDRGPKSRSTGVSPRQIHSMSGNLGGGPERDTSYDSVVLQKQMQEEIKQKQDRIMDTITALQEQFENVARAAISDKKEIDDQEEKLSLLRKLIKEEQKNYFEQQKILEEQQQKFLKAQQLIPSRSRQSTSPVSQHRKSGGRRPKSTVTEQPPDHFRILENRLKSVEAERQALLDLNSSLQDEINTLKKLALNSDTGDVSGIVFKKQNAELTEHNKNLKSLVHRLNIELSRYQAKYRPPRREEVDDLALPEEGPIPEWLVNMKYLSPLIMAYDDRLRDKSELIRAYETNLASIKARMLEIVRENQRLHLMNNETADDDEGVDVNEWNLLQEHAKLVVEENTILMQEIDLKDRRIDEMQEDFDLEIDKLAKKIRLLANETRNSQRDVSNLQIDNEMLRKRCKEAENECTKKITEEEAERRVEKARRPLTEKIENFEKDKDHSDTRFQAVLKEKQELAVKLTDSNANCSQLQLELDLMTKSLRKMEKKFVTLQNKLDAAKEKELVATDTISQLLSVAERNSSERDEFAKMIESQNNETIMNYKQIIEEERKLEQLRKEVEKYKRMAKKNAAEVVIRVKEKDDEIDNLRNKHNEEISNLKDIIRSRQMMVDQFQSDKRQFENEIDVLWKSVTEENEDFKSSTK